jgi:hypothetical protein
MEKGASSSAAYGPSGPREVSLDIHDVA